MTDKQFQTNFNLLYTVYSIPNIVLPFFGGYLVDRFSARAVNVLCSSFILTGQLLVALGAHLELFWLMILGRICFGFGGESICVSQSAMVQQWFCKSCVAPEASPALFLTDAAAVHAQDWRRVPT